MYLESGNKMYLSEYKKAKKIDVVVREKSLIILENVFQNRTLLSIASVQRPYPRPSWIHMIDFCNFHM